MTILKLVEVGVAGPYFAPLPRRGLVLGAIQGRGTI